MSETPLSENVEPVVPTPRVAGELYPEDYRDFQSDVAAQQEHRLALSSRLGEVAVPGRPQVEAVHVFSDREGQHFVVSSGQNKGDVISERGAARLGLAAPSEELEKLQMRKDMNREEWNNFSAMADLLTSAAANGAPSEAIDAQAQDVLYKFNISANKHYYSPAVRSTFHLLYLGARREKADGLGALGDALSFGYLNESDGHILSQSVSEIERFKKMDGYGPETIEQQLVQSTAANVAHIPQGAFSRELTILLNAYALGVTSRTPYESSNYRQQLDQLITD